MNQQGTGTGGFEWLNNNCIRYTRYSCKEVYVIERDC